MDRGRVRKKGLKVHLASVCRRLKNAGGGLRIFTPVIILASAMNPSWADYYFNPEFLADDPSAVADLAYFEKANTQLPGIYQVDIYLNGLFFASRNVTFRSQAQMEAQSAASAETDATDETSVIAQSVSETVSPLAAPDETGLLPCFTLEEMEALAVQMSLFPALKKQASDACLDISRAIPGAQTFFDFDTQRLNITIPQAVLAKTARGYIPPEYWDNGINALLLNYNFSGSYSINKDGGEYNASFLGLRGGVNLGAWRVRNYSTWQYNDNVNNRSKQSWNHISTYVQRSIPALKGDLTLGDSYTPNEIFDSVHFRGIQLASNDSMLPDSMRGFAPTVRGIAKSHAKVSISQKGFVIYETYVPPGAFAINDLYPLSSSGDLFVTVTESDGSASNYSVPYSSVPVMQREGRIKYALTAGELKGNSQQENKPFFQGTLIAGMPGEYTLYGGTQYADDYSSFSAGAGITLGNFGAFSIDLTHADSVLADNKRYQGQSLRFQYAKSMTDYGTNLQLMGYRYSTAGFYTLDEALYKSMKGTNGTEMGLQNHHNLYYAKRGRIQASVSQSLWDYGSLYVTGSQQSYWNTSETNSLLQLGYNHSLNGINYNVSYSYSQTPWQSSDKMFAVNISVPLERWLSSGADVTRRRNSMFASYSMSSSSNGRVLQNAGLSGTLLENSNLSYSIQQSYGNRGDGAGGNLNMSYRGAYGNTELGYNYSRNGDYQQMHYGASGGVVVHRNGITFGQPLGESNVLVEVPGAKNVRIENTGNVKTNGKGYAILPYASVYRQNKITLDTNSLDDHVDLDDAVVYVIPTQGAMVRASFNARVGIRALLTLSYQKKPIPFGAIVMLKGGEGSSIVGEDGQVYLSGLPLKGTLHVNWGAAENQQCSIGYVLSDEVLQQVIVRQSFSCH